MKNHAFRASLMNMKAEPEDETARDRIYSSTLDRHGYFTYIKRRMFNI